jgi:prepilin-type N-terminal cleavage/methylation domain-containing protein
MNSKGFTLVELMITVAILGILAAMGVVAISGRLPVQTKDSCLNAGGKWSEGIQYGRVTQICTYN